MPLSVWWISNKFCNTNASHKHEQLPKKDESSIGAVYVCNRCMVQIELLKIVPWWIGVDFAETRLWDDIFFMTEKNKVS